MKIIQYTDGEYTDQHGFVHKCVYISASLEVEKTAEFIGWDYYSEHLKDYIWITADGRRFRAHSKTDYGPGDLVFTELDTKERVTFYKFREHAKRRGLYPLIHKNPISGDNP